MFSTVAAFNFPSDMGGIVSNANGFLFSDVGKFEEITSDSPVTIMEINATFPAMVSPYIVDLAGDSLAVVSDTGHPFHLVDLSTNKIIADLPAYEEISENGAYYSSQCQQAQFCVQVFKTGAPASSSAGNLNIH